MTTDIMTIDNTDNGDAIQINGEFVSTLNMSDPAAKVKAYNALSDAISLNDVMGATLTIVDILTFPGVRKSRDGSADKPCVNVALIDADGSVYFSQSEGVYNSAMRMVSLWFDPTHPENGLNNGQGIKCVCKEQTLRNGNTIKKLSLI